MAKFHGVGVNFGIDTTIVGVNGMFQTRDHTYMADSELITDTGDTPVSKCYWNYREEATFTYVAVNPSRNIGACRVDVPQIGTFISIVDYNYTYDSTDGGYNYAINAYRGPWLVDGVSISNSNTSAVRVTVRLSRYPFIQNV